MVHVHSLDAGNHLGKYRERILECSEQTVLTVEKLLGIDQVDVTIARNPTWTIPETGFGGYAPEANLVQISLDPNTEGFAANLESELSATIAHELHHAMRWRGPGYGKTLLEVLITEGLAQCFEVSFRDGKTPIYAMPLDSNQMDELLGRARFEFDNPNYNHNAWFFGDEANNLPRWTGYKLGFELIKKYLVETDQTAAQAWNVTAKTVLETLGDQT